MKPYPLKCGNCGKLYLKWQGYCQCGASESIISVTKETIAAKRVRNRAKRSEQGIARRMQAIDGTDPAFRNVTSSISRVGHITGMRIDALTANHVIENKNRIMPKWFLDAYLLIVQRPIDFEKHPLLHLEPSNLKRDYTLNGVKYRLDTIAVIPQERYESLIISERILSEIRQVVDGAGTNGPKLAKIRELW